MRHFWVGRRVEHYVPSKYKRAKAAEGAGGSGGQRGTKGVEGAEGEEGTQPSGSWWDAQVQDVRWNPDAGAKEAKIWYINKTGQAQPNQSPGWVRIPFPLVDGNQEALLRRPPSDVKKDLQAQAKSRREEAAEAAAMARAMEREKTKLHPQSKKRHRTGQDKEAGEKGSNVGARGHSESASPSTSAGCTTPGLLRFYACVCVCVRERERERG